MVTELGLASGQVRVVPYDDAWPALYASEITRLLPLLSANGVSLRLEHTGSTAVPGLSAKPIIDILAGLPTHAVRGEAVAAIEVAGYVHKREQDQPGWDFFRRGDPRQFHLHLVRVDSSFWHEHLLFRGWLREHDETAAAYSMLKQDLAARFPTNREAYISGKAAFVAEVLSLASKQRHRQPVGVFTSFRSST